MRPRLVSFELAWTAAAFDAIYPAPPVSVLPHGIATMHPARYFDSVLAQIPIEQSVGLRLTLWMVALAPLFTIGRLGTIASITAEERARVLERLITSRIYVVRQLAMSLKAVATLLYAQSDAVRAAMSTPLRRNSVLQLQEPGAVSVAPMNATENAGLVSAAHLTSRARTARAEKTGGTHDHAA